MIVKNLKLINFRNIDSLYESFSPAINIIIGENAQGKTNFIESIYFALTGRSFRAFKNQEMISLKKNQSYVGIGYEDGGIEKTIEILLDRNKNRRIKLNGKEIKSLRDLKENFSVSLFTPEDLRIIKGLPAERRRFFDNFYSLYSNKYNFHLNSYNKILKERNKLLKDRVFSRDLLKVFDQGLGEHGIEIEILRESFRSEIEIETKKLLWDFSNGRDIFLFRGAPEMYEILSSDNPKLSYIKRINDFYERDRELGFTSFGSHVSDFYLYINDKLSKTYASQGQQRSLILALEFAMVNLWEREKSVSPILLLDDVFSELDEMRKELFFPYIERLQTFITQTSLENLEGNIKVFKMKDGGIYERY